MIQYFCRLYSILGYHKIMVIIPRAIQYTLVTFFLFGCARGMNKLLDQGLNPCHWSGPSSCTDKVGSLTHRTTRECLLLFSLYIYINIEYIYIYLFIYIYFFIFFSHTGYYKILNIVPCATWEVLAYLFYIVYLSISNS